MKAEEEEESRQIEMAIKLSLGGGPGVDRSSDVEQPCSSRSLWQVREHHSRENEGDEASSSLASPVTVVRRAPENQSAVDGATYRVEKKALDNSRSSNTTQSSSDSVAPSIRSQDELNEEMRRKRLEYFDGRSEK